MSQLVQKRWDAKLTNWALWKIGQTKPGGGGAPRDWWNAPPRPPQPLVGEAVDTDDLLVRMSIGDKDDRNRYAAVVAWYTWAGSVKDWAIALDIHQDTLHDRVRSARYRLDDLDRLRRCNMLKVPKSDHLCKTYTHGSETCG